VQIVKIGILHAMVVYSIKSEIFFRADKMVKGLESQGTSDFRLSRSSVPNTTLEDFGSK
jgi:hypothetical protein